MVATATLGGCIIASRRLADPALRRATPATQNIWRHDRIGLGDVPVAEFARALDEAAFDGPCTLEIIDADPEASILASHRAIADLGFAPPRQAS